MGKNILIINGPNLNLLGEREEAIYGIETLEDINKKLIKTLKKNKYDYEFFQSNHEGEIVDKFQEKRKWLDGVLINPAAFTHTSVALRDVIEAINKPVVEVHLSNIYSREEFRKRSFVSGVSIGGIFGFGVDSYILGLQALINYLERN